MAASPSCYVCNHRIILACSRCGADLTVTDERGTGMRNEATEMRVEPCECVKQPATSSVSVEKQGAVEAPDAVACVAGRELDALIAERVMGYPQSKGFVGPMVMWHGDPCWRNDAGFPVTCPRYSTDIAAAMQVVEHLRKLGFGFVMSDNMDHAPLWNVDVVGDLKIEGEAHAESLPLAICLAALKAMEQHSTDTDALRG